ncbi:aldolase/citrate lyase family protein [Sphingomonas sp.]|uniref:HpcH/HpaI aldolase family protein n=1 Tax=Sphingomonas sp. TaxID=28214 RepID=UPI0025E79F68|nr:aldolase/citrate lyase family protein [Sphingomonas sp.]
MAGPRPDPREFKARLKARDPMIGTFMKVPAPQNTEVLGLDGFDFVILDEEHAPWHRGTLDTALLATRAYGIAGIVRIARPDANSVLSVLDDGAIGIMVPHVDSAEKARAIISYARYRGGVRGAGASRGGEYGKRGGANYQYCDETSVVIAMIEDARALDRIDEIVAVEGLDAIFLGRGDLALSLGNAGPGAPTIEEAVATIVAACGKAGVPVAALTQSLTSDEGRYVLGLGVKCLVVASDLGFLRQAAGAALREFKTMEI